MDEKELVIRAKKGDIDAFCILYDNYIRKLFNYAYYKLGNSEDAEDVVQDCMLTAFEQLGKLKNPKAFSSAGLHHRIKSLRVVPMSHSRVRHRRWSVVCA